jgi:hypothetical protein
MIFVHVVQRPNKSSSACHILMNAKIVVKKTATVVVWSIVVTYVAKHCAMDACRGEHVPYVNAYTFVVNV